MPVDAEPHEAGQFHLLAFQGRVLAVHARKDRPIARAISGSALYRSHFASCPHAEQHRRTKR